MKRLLLMCVIIPTLAFGSSTSSLERVREQVHMEIVNFDGNSQCLERILNLVENELHFAQYEELCQEGKQ